MTIINKEMLRYIASAGVENYLLSSCAKLCHVSYCTNKTPNIEGFVLIEQVQVGCSQAIIGRVGETLYITFRGSDEFRDFITDVNFFKRSLNIWNVDCGKVHSGFYNYYEKLRDICFKYIIEYKDIVMTGHSLGSSVTYLALETKIRFPVKKVRCVTFGSPRLGNKKFVDVVDKKVAYNIRVRNSKDPIPSFPLISYTHCGKDIVFDENGRCIKRPGGVRRLCNVLKSCTIPIISRLKQSPFDFHYMEAYHYNIRNFTSTE